MVAPFCQHPSASTPTCVLIFLNLSSLKLTVPTVVENSVWSRP